jgi:hypothetical protein
MSTHEGLEIVGLLVATLVGLYILIEAVPHEAFPVVVALAFVVLIVLGPVLHPTSAEGFIHSSSVLEGPNNAILDLDGAAMAPDGTGGIVYRKEFDGVPHVFAVPFANGTWGRSLEVDREDGFGASQPAIAAGEGGRLLVVWVQLRNVSTGDGDEYELMSASLQPGTSMFGPATIVAPSVGGDIRGVDPSLAMAPSGQAYVVYRLITNDCEEGDPITSVCASGKGIEVRVARFNYRAWNSLGAVNRTLALGMREPTASNAPSIGIDLAGEGLVAWQEPDAGGAARIWARRLFGVTPGNVLEVSPETIAGHTITSDAEAPVVAMSPYGEARVAFRIHGESGSAVTTTQLYVNSLNSALGLKAAQFKGAVAVPGATGAAIGAPSAAIDADGDYRVVWPQGGDLQGLAGNTETTTASTTLGATTGERALTTIGSAGGGATAWIARSAEESAVDVRDEFPQGGSQLGQFGGNIPGVIGNLVLGGSGRGDALIGWTVGPPGDSEVVADFVQAPPQPFVVFVPLAWVRADAVTLSWEEAPDAVAGDTYAVYVDGKQRIAGLTTLSAHLNARALGNGIHHVQVLATDPAGQHTLSDLAAIKIDADPPIVKLALIYHGRGVRVNITDAASGVDAKATQVAFGDGTRSGSGATVTHLYRHGGTYLITARVRDNAGNGSIVHLRVTVR